MKFNFIFLTLYMFVGMVPYFGSIDKVFPQVFYLSFLNLTSLIYIVIQEKDKTLKTLNNISNNWSFLLYSLFIIWSSITAFISINKLESIYTISEIFVHLCSFFFILYFLSNIKNLTKTFFYIIMSLIVVETTFVIAPYLSEIYLIGSPTQRGMIYRGYTGNINILAYLLLIKYPFLIYFTLIKTGSKMFNFFLKCIIVFIITSVFATRSAILALLIISILIFLITYYFNRHIKSEFKLKNLIKIIFLPLLVGFILNNLQTIVFKTGNIQSRLATFSNISDDYSLDSRLKYYSGAIKSFAEKPFLGKGIGSWEYESIKYAKEDMTDYIVPYHAHNDYLEILAETGLPGFIIFFGIIIMPLIFLIRSFFDDKIDNDSKLFSIFLITSIIVYLIDSMFNFPFDRAVQQIHLSFLLAIVITHYKLNSITFKHKFFLIVIIILLSPISIYASYRYYISSTHQMELVKQFNRQDFSTPPLDVINQYDYKIKTLSATSLPMNTIRGLYHLNNDKLEDAVVYFREGIKANPHIYITESFLGYTLDKLEQNDSALYYTKLAYENMPNNPVHFAHYINSLVQSKDSLQIKQAYNSIKDKISNQLYTEVYLIAMSQITNPDNKLFTLEDIDFNYETGNDRLKKGYYLFQVGEDNMYLADYNYQQGLKFFENEQFEEAYKFFQEASEINPYEYAYKENTANTLMRLGRDDDALQILNQLINEDKNISAKVFYLRGLILYSKNQKEDACHDLKYANDTGFLGETKVFEVLCGQ